MEDSMILHIRLDKDGNEIKVMKPGRARGLDFVAQPTVHRIPDMALFVVGDGHARRRPHFNPHLR